MDRRLPLAGQPSVTLVDRPPGLLADPGSRAGGQRAAGSRVVSRQPFTRAPCYASGPVEVRTMDAPTILANTRALAADFARERAARQRRRELAPADFDQLGRAGVLLAG